MELLLPAGDIAKAYTAFQYGADAIYCGLSMFSLRTKENIFTEKNIEEIIKFAHKNNKKVYVTVNAFPHQCMIPHFESHLKFLEKLQPDGVIFADFGVLHLANKFAPTVPKHLSVQTSTVNVPAIKMWQELGVSRIILAREMSITEVKTIHEQIPEMELEYFVHGSVCMAYSGRCLLSTFNSGRDANRGVCNHSCRWNYRVTDETGQEIDVSAHHKNPNKKISKTDKSKNIHDFEKQNFIEEETRRDEIIPVEEDFHGTHIMSSRDMCMIEHLDEIKAAGVCSLKVEGRNKTPYYLATVARAYRQALDDLEEGKKFDPTLWDEINATANRGFFPGFLHGKPQDGDIQYEGNRSTSIKEFCGITGQWKNKRLEILPKNRITEGGKLEFIFPKRSDDFSIIAEDLQFGNEKATTLHGGDTNQIATIKCTKKVPENIFIRQKSN